MFQRLTHERAHAVRLTVDGAVVAACSGDTVAALLLSLGAHPYRTEPVSESARAPYCMMGVCFECLVRIDGIASRQGCLVEVRDGMRVETQHGRREVMR